MSAHDLNPAAVEAGQASEREEKIAAVLANKRVPLALRSTLLHAVTVAEKIRAKGARR